MTYKANPTHLLLSSSVLLMSFFSGAAYASVPADERITVVGKKPAYLNDLDGVLPVSLVDNFALRNSNSIADMFSSEPQVNLNGQGGLLQTISIRGLSRWRIQTLVEGVPIHTERRAGNAAEFIAPGLVGDAYVLSGAASTQLGSGALGGGIDLRLAATADTVINATYGAQQDYRSVQMLSGQEWDDGGLYWGASLRHANDGEDSANQTLLNGFEQSVGWIRQVSETSLVKDALLVLSKTNNVGKASSETPAQRSTMYPSNDHWLAKLDFDWMNAKVYAHNARLETQINRPGQRTNYLSNKGLGWGASIGSDVSASLWQFNWQLAFDGRNEVEAKELELTATAAPVFDRTNLSGRQQAWSMTVNSVRQYQYWDLAAGIRAEHMRQHGSIEAYHSLQDSHLSGFVGAKKTWSENWISGVYLSHGFRVPTLTERFFSGSTPRGMTQGDPALQSEQAINLQADIEYQDRDVSFKFSAFHQSIKHYIERVELSPNLQQYMNLGDATIDGVNYSLDWTLLPYLNLKVQGQWLWGEDDKGEPINDVSPHQHDARITWQSDSHTLWLSMTYRQAHKHPGSSELATDSVVYFRAGYENVFSPSVTASIFVNNLTNKTYSVSSDNLAPNAQARDIEMKLRYLF